MDALGPRKRVIQTYLPYNYRGDRGRASITKRLHYSQSARHSIRPKLVIVQTLSSASVLRHLMRFEQIYNYHCMGVTIAKKTVLKEKTVKYYVLHHTHVVSFSVPI